MLWRGNKFAHSVPGSKSQIFEAGIDELGVHVLHRRMTEQFPIFGGPFDGRSYQNSAIIYCARGTMASPIHEGVRTPRPDEADYQYHMVDVADGGRAFVPSSNDDLLNAYKKTAGEAGGQAASVLLGEIKRRSLGI